MGEESSIQIQNTASITYFHVKYYFSHNGSVAIVGVWSPALVPWSHYSSRRENLLSCCRFLVPLDDWEENISIFVARQRGSCDGYGQGDFVFSLASKASSPFSHGHCEEWFTRRDPTYRVERSFMSKICFWLVETRHQCLWQLLYCHSDWWSLVWSQTMHINHVFKKEVSFYCLKPSIISHQMQKQLATSHINILQLI